MDRIRVNLSHSLMQKNIIAPLKLSLDSIDKNVQLHSYFGIEMDKITELVNNVPILIDRCLKNMEKG